MMKFSDLILGFLIGIMAHCAFLNFLEINKSTKHTYHLPGETISYKYGYGVEHGKIFGHIPNIGYEVITKYDSHVVIEYKDILGEVIILENGEKTLIP